MYVVSFIDTGVVKYFMGIHEAVKFAEASEGRVVIRNNFNCCVWERK